MCLKMCVMLLDSAWGSDGKGVLLNEIQKMRQKLLQDGLSEIVADRAVFNDIKDPSTACGLLVKRAINGDQAAVSLIGTTSLCSVSR